MAVGPFWSAIAPIEQTNLITNPSFERGTAGWGTIQAGTVGSAANVQQFGAWSGSIAPTSNGTTGAISPTFTATNGVAYTFSAYVRGANGIPYKLGIGDSNGVNLVGSTNFTGGGTWQRVVGSWTEASGATRRLVFQKNANADTTAFYIDGVDITAGSLTTHIDGDQDGCYWLGVPHASQSVRSGTYRGGGSVILLQSLGLIIDEEPGIGMPPQEITAQSFALQPGAEFQRARSAERSLTLQATFIGTNTQDLHITRRRVFNVLKIDAVSPQQPTRFWYSGAEGTVQIDAVYAGGGEFTGRQGFSEVTPLRFVAHDPYWYAPTQQGTALAPRVALGSANFIVKRDPYGRWGTMGQSGTTFQGVSATGGVSDLLYNNGTLFACGSWGTAGGTKAVNIAMYFPDTNAWGTLTGGTVVAAGPLLKMAYAPWGSLYFGGFLLQTAGTATQTVAQWNSNGFGSLHGGTVGTSSAGRLQTMLLSPTGTLFLTGPGMTSFGGTTGTIIGMWNRGTWGTLTGGSVNSVVSALAYGKDNRLYAGGVFTSAGGTSAQRIAQWNTAWGTMTGGMDQGVFALSVAPDARIIAGGGFSTAGAGSAAAMAAWNGVQFQALGSGIINTLSPVQVLDIYTDQLTGDIYASGIFNFAGGLKVPDGVARYNGYAWLPLDIDVAGLNAGTYQAIELAPDRTLYAGGTWAGTAQAAAVAQIVNTGMGEAYPTFKARNTGSGTVRMYQLVNTYPTGDGLWFNLILQPGEEVTLTTEPGARSFTSDAQGNVFPTIMPGSNIASFRLTPGTNYISLFCDSDNVAASIYWQNRHDSADGGTIY